MKFPAFEPIELKNHDEIFNVLVSEIEPDENRLRTNINHVSLNELALSIKKQGIIQPVVARIMKNGKYQLIAGERRWRAAQIAGLKSIPVIIRNYDTSDRLSVALIENIQRENLNPLEEAQAISRLLEECSMTHHEVSECIGKSRTTVTNLLRLLGLEDAVKQMVNAGLLEMGHARALLSLSGQQQIDSAEIIINKKLSVRETERLIQNIHLPPEKKDNLVPAEYEIKAKKWKNYLSEKLESKVNVQLNAGGKGRLVIHFNSIEEADWLMENIHFRQTEEIE